MIEWRIEAAWIALLGPLMPAGTSVVRWGDQTHEASYPCVLVHCLGSESRDDDAGLDRPTVLFVCMTQTHPDTDPTGLSLHTLLGTIRDAARGATIASLLTAATSGLYVHVVNAAQSDIPPLDGDDHLRSATLTIEHLATCTDTLDAPEEPDTP